MKLRGWHMARDGRAVTLSRPGRGRMDVAAKADVPDANATKLALQVRQDLWRGLQHVRGFSPVVRVEPQDMGCRITAGGQIDSKQPLSLADREILVDILANPANRRRWMIWAGARRVS